MQETNSRLDYKEGIIKLCGALLRVLCKPKPWSWIRTLGLCLAPLNIELGFSNNFNSYDSNGNKMTFCCNMHG